MTDRVYALTVTLDIDIRDDDVEPTVQAIKQIKHVLSVTEHTSDFEWKSAVARARNLLGNKLWDALHETPVDDRSF